MKEETRFLLALAAEWLELDSAVEGIRFDSEIVRIEPSLLHNPVPA
jgi:hypothetical protein